MSEHDALRALISKYVDGQASPEERSRVEAAIQRSAELNRYYQELVRLNRLLDQMPQQTASGDWEQTIQAALKKRESQGDRQVSSQFFIRSSLSLVLLLGAVFSFQLYIKRGIQSRMKQSSDDIGDQFSPGNTNVLRTFNESTNSILNLESHP